MRNANMSFTIIILSLQDKLLCEFCIIFTSHYFTYRMSCLHGGISKTSSVHFTQLPVSNMKFPYGITSYWTLMICLEWTFKVYLCVAGFSYARTCIESPCNFGTRWIWARIAVEKFRFINSLRIGRWNGEYGDFLPPFSCEIQLLFKRLQQIS